MDQFPLRRVPFLWLILAVMILLAAGCAQSNQIGPRPSADVAGSVEAYLQRYQPGPEPRLFQTTRVYDRNGILLAELYDEGRRTWVNLDRISKHLVDATIATEDSTFYTNLGIDPARIAGAYLQNQQEGEIVSGASTITMQLARNLFLGPDQRYDQSMDRKVLEAGLAQELTNLFTKDELLTMYLNLANYGHLAYGPEAAAQVYFAKPAADLNLAEATLIAGIPQRPAELDLFRNFEAAKARQRVVLDLMVRHGYLSQEEADAAFEQPIFLNPEPDRRDNLAPHFVQYLEETLDARMGQNATRRSGLRITSTLDYRMQTVAQQIVATRVAELRPQYDLSNGALVALRPGSNEIMVMVGSADFNNTEIAGQVNVAVRPRQPGSSIKPVMYALALNDNLISPATVLWDIPVAYTVTTGTTYRPVNYDGRFHGPVTVRSALANSYNIPAVKMLDGLTVQRMLDGARAMGIRSLSQDASHYGLSLTLGGGDVTLLELTGAFAVLANGGRYVEPSFILSVTNEAGHILCLNAEGTRFERCESIQAPGSAEGEQVISPAAAFLVTDILSDNTARTPMFGANSPLRLSRPAAAKTGTTDDWRDNWTAGFTRYLVAGVWAGNSDGHPMSNTSGLTGAAPIWHDFMEAVLADPALLATLGAPQDPAAWEFTPPPDVERRNECPPGVTCREGGEYFSRAWIEAAGERGILVDSVAEVGTAPVYVDRGEGAAWTAYCRTEPAATRRLLKLPGRFGLPAAGDAPAEELSANARREQMNALAWSLRHPTPVDLGPCDRLAETAPQALRLMPQGGDERLQVLVDLSAAMDPNAGGVAGDGAVPVASLGPVEGPMAAPPPSNFVLAQPVSHHGSCPGNYLIGQVLDEAGAPLAGVRIHMVDEWGNQALTASKDGPADYGQFDFPLNPFANRYVLTVVDEGGNPLGGPVVVEHLQGEGGDAPCHTVVWRRQ